MALDHQIPSLSEKLRIHALAEADRNLNLSTRTRDPKVMPPAIPPDSGFPLLDRVPHRQPLTAPAT